MMQETRLCYLKLCHFQDNFEARFLGFWHQESASVEVETEILTLEPVIAEERRRIDQLDKKLEEMGESLGTVAGETSERSSNNEVGMKATVSL